MAVSTSQIPIPGSNYPSVQNSFIKILLIDQLNLVRQINDVTFIPWNSTQSDKPGTDNEKTGH